MSGKKEVLRFSMKRKEIPVILQDEGGKDVEFTLREFNDEQRDEFLEFGQKNGLFRMGKTSEEVQENLTAGKVQIPSGMMRKTVSLCLYDSEKNLVPEDTLRTEFPGRVVMALFLKAIELNEFGSKAKEKAKNVSKVSGTSGIE